MTDIPCCYTWPSDRIRDEVITCHSRRLPDLPMCQKHMYRTFREAIYGETLPTDVWVELAKDTEHMMTIRETVSRFEINHALRSDKQEREAAERRRREEAASVVYYCALMGGRVKIGTTTHLARRMRELRVRDEDVLALEQGGRLVELERHHQFAHLRIGKTEEFRRSDDLLEHIARTGFMLAS